MVFAFTDDEIHIIYVNKKVGIVWNEKGKVDWDKE